MSIDCMRGGKEKNYYFFSLIKSVSQFSLTGEREADLQ